MINDLCWFAAVTDPYWFGHRRVVRCECECSVITSLGRCGCDCGCLRTTGLSFLAN